MKNELFTYKNLLTTTLILFLTLLLIRLDFFIPLINGHTPLQDFDHYYQLTTELLAGNNPYQTSTVRTWGPPLVFIYHLPFQLFSVETARTFATLINIMSGIFTCVILSKKTSKTYRLTFWVLFTLVLFSSFPARFSLEMGQPNLLLMLFVTLIIFTKGENIKTVLLSLLVSIKTYFLLSVFTFARKRLRVFYKSIFITFFIMFILSLMIRPEVYYFYYKNTLPELLSTNSQISNTDYYNQTYFSTLARVGITFPDKNLYAFVSFIGLVLIYTVGNFELAVILSIILSIVSWQHYYVILFPIYVKALRDSPKNFYDYLFVALLTIFWWIEFPWLHTAKLTTFTGLLASHYFISALLLAIYIVLMHWLTFHKIKSYNTENENKI